MNEEKTDARNNKHQEEQEEEEKEVEGGGEKTQSKQTESLFLIIPKYVNILHIIYISYTTKLLQRQQRPKH